MAYDIRRRNEVKKYFVHKQMPMTQAAKLAGVPVNTARRWKDLAYEAGDDWEKLRAAFALSSGSRDDLMKTIINDYVICHQAIMESLKSPDNDMTAKEKVEALTSLADGFSKTMKSAGQASPELSKLAVANDIIQLLGEFVQKHYPQHIPAFLEILEPFGEEVSKNYGK
jgi:hypothetical protein|nr:MAG TPA: Protein of unknown function (DUF1804) [Caudoviricetes sp.]